LLAHGFESYACLANATKTLPHIGHVFSLIFLSAARLRPMLLLSMVKVYQVSE